jgi:hypothetical protein
MDKLPPAVQEYWKTNFNVPPATDPDKSEKKEDTKKDSKEKHDH